MLLDRGFVDAASGKVTQRPRLEALAFVREGDIVVVHRGLARRKPRRSPPARLFPDPRLVAVMVDRVGARVSGFPR
jgi:hypothetical protein